MFILYIIGIVISSVFAALFYSGSKEYFGFNLIVSLPFADKDKSWAIKIETIYILSLLSWLGCVIMIIDKNFYWKNWFKK